MDIDDFITMMIEITLKCYNPENPNYNALSVLFDEIENESDSFEVEDDKNSQDTDNT